MNSESKIGFENRDPGFELKTETGFQNWWKPVFKEPKIAKNLANLAKIYEIFFQKCG